MGMSHLSGALYQLWFDVVTFPALRVNRKLPACCPSTRERLSPCSYCFSGPPRNEQSKKVPEVHIHGVSSSSSPQVSRSECR